MKIEQSILTIGTVVDTNDPQQMGRLRINCPKWGDTSDTLVVDLPWAAYVTPFGGILTRGTRGPENVITEGPVAYGMWAIPKVGATVVCMRLDEDPNHRMWIGSIHPDHLAHTLPSGRYLDSGTVGPVSSTEQPIEPLSSNMNKAFGSASGNHERLTRGAENQAASISSSIIDKVVSSQSDDRNDIDRTGYQTSRIAPPGLEFKETGGNFDPQVYSLTTPGLHSFVMDDSLKNGKIRIHSTSGNQIILDDTNERIYISTSDGKNYIEMDKAGNVDIYSKRRISAHAELGFNFTTEGEFRVSANEIHFRSVNDMRFEADNNFVVRADANINMRAIADMDMQTGSNLSIYTGANVDWEAVGQFKATVGTSVDWKTGTYFNSTVGTDYNLQAGATLHMESVSSFSVDAGSTLNLESSANMDFLAGGNTNIDATEIHLNDGLAGNAKAVTAALQSSPEKTVTDSQHAYLTNRVPTHEPWGRISNNPTGNAQHTDEDSVENKVSWVLNLDPSTNISPAILELPYTSTNANKIDLGDDLGRNDNWRR